MQNNLLPTTERRFTTDTYFLIARPFKVYPFNFLKEFIMKSHLATRLISAVTLLVLVGSTFQIRSAIAAPLAMPSMVMQWPWALGQSWQVTQGPHGANWSGLDINGGSLSWGSPTRQEIRAVAAGYLTKMSSCYVVIDHGGGWQTGYVHIRAEVSSGPVSANQVIGIIETNQAAAQCGGRADAPHLHLRLLYNNSETSIVGATFGGWTVGVESGYYQDPANKRSTYTKNGVTRYIYQSLDNTVVAPPTVFANGSSYLWQDQNWGRANLRVCADNLNGNVINVHFSRSGRVWQYSQRATSNCVTFWDMDGAGALLTQTTYYSRVALNQQPSAAWPIPCAGATGGQGLCDLLRRP
jgi:hypothetical protein